MSFWIVNLTLVASKVRSTIGNLSTVRFDKTAKKVKKVFDWASAHGQLAQFEAEYDALLNAPMKDRSPKYDLRTTESGVRWRCLPQGDQRCARGMRAKERRHVRNGPKLCGR
jgi:hypothetical protein